MTFQNEAISQVEDEKSEFFRATRDKMRLGFVSGDQWTVDRSRNMALVRVGAGHDVDSKDEEYWSFLEGGREYRFRTRQLVMRSDSKQALHMKRSIRFLVAAGFSEPNDAVNQAIKAALTAYKDFGALSSHDSCELVLTTDDGEVL